MQLGDGRELPSAVTIWTAGFGVPDLAARSGLSTDALGRLLTDETLTSVDDERIVAAGDSAAPSDLPFRMSCQAAGPLGAHAADTVLSRIAGEQPAPIDLGFAGQCISLGRRAGIFQFAHRDDTARGSTSAAALARSSRNSCASSPSSSWRTRHASPARHTWAQGRASASSCCGPSAARRRPPPNGQPSQTTH